MCRVPHPETSRLAPQEEIIDQTWWWETHKPSESAVHIKQWLLAMGAVGHWPEGLGNERKKGTVKYGRQRDKSEVAQS